MSTILQRGVGLLTLCIGLLCAAARAQPCTFAPGSTTVRVSVKRVLGPGGLPGPAWASLAHVRDAFCEASHLLRSQTGIALELLPVEDLVDPGEPRVEPTFGPTFSWFDVSFSTAQITAAMERAALIDPATYKWRPDAINVYLVNSSTPGLGGVSGIPLYPTNNPFSPHPGYEHILFVMSDFNQNLPLSVVGWLLAHEIGHNLGLWHTSHNILGVEVGAGANCLSPSGVNCATAGDGVCDTPPDPGNPSLLASLYLNPQGCMNQAAFDTVRFNVMSIYSGLDTNVATMTPGQAAKMLTTIAATKPQIVVGATRPVISSVSPASATGVGPSTLTLTGTDLPTSGQLQLNVGGAVCTTAPAACAPRHASTQLAPGASSQSLTFTFTQPLPPGLHGVSLWQDGRLVAARAEALEVLPYLTLTPENQPGSLDFRLALQTAAPFSPIAVAAGALAVNPTPAAPPLTGTLWIDLAPPTLVVGLAPLPPLLTDGAGRFDVLIPLGGLASAQRIAFQGFDQSGLHFTNPIRYIAP